MTKTTTALQDPQIIVQRDKLKAIVDLFIRQGEEQQDEMRLRLVRSIIEIDEAQRNKPESKSKEASKRNAF